MIQRLSKTLQTLSKSHLKVEHFNSTLPILLKVLQKTKPNYYLLQVGKKVLESRSQKDLEIGAKYYAMMKNTPTGAMMLTSLKPQPNLCKTPLVLNEESLKSVLQQTSFEELRDFGIEGMTLAKNKEELSTFGFFLLGLQKNIVSFLLEDSKQEQPYIQIKKHRDFLEFFAFYANFGAIAGKVFKKEEGLKLELRVQFQSVIDFLKSYQIELRGIGEVEFLLFDRIEPLFALQDTLLDLKI